MSAAPQLRPGARYRFRTRDEASVLGSQLADLFPDPSRAELGLQELLLNAVEHGNLELGSATKARLLREGTLEEEIERRLRTPPYRDRHVRVDVCGTGPLVEIVIRDQGPGFDWRAAVAQEFSWSAAPNGRGIVLTRATCFPSLEYLDPGNVVIVRVRWP